VGIGSIVGWGMALFLLAACATSRRRTTAYVVALVLSILGFILAKINSHNISQIEVDRSPVGGASLPRDDVPKPGDPKGVPSPSYRDAGKQKRDESAKLKRPELSAIAEDAEVSVARRLPEADLLRADAYDRLNLFFARIVPWLALALVCFDYLSRFNRTLGYLPPIPIAGRAVDALSRKTRAAHLQTSDPAVVRRYLAGVVRKGETFIYLGPEDPIPAGELHRWAFGPWRWRPLKKLLFTGEGFPTSDFVFDSAWFGRYCFVATRPDAAGGLLADLADYLRARTVPRAAARRTVNVVWASPEPLLARRLRDLAALARETNFKLLVISPDPPPDTLAPLFDERLRQPSSSCLSR